MGFQIEFRKTGRTYEWNDTFENILEFATERGIKMENGCRSGVCGTCKTRLFSGEVFMVTEDGLTAEDKESDLFLPCEAIPLSNLVLDA